MRDELRRRGRGGGRRHGEFLARRVLHKAGGSAEGVGVAIATLLVAWHLDGTFRESLARLLLDGVCHVGLDRICAFLAFPCRGTICKWVFGGGGDVFVFRVVELHSLFCGVGSFGADGGFLWFVRAGG